MILPWWLVLCGRQKIRNCVTGCFLGKLREKQNRDKNKNGKLADLFWHQTVECDKHKTNLKCISRLAHEEVKSPFNAIVVMVFQNIQMRMTALPGLNVKITCQNAHWDHKLWHSKSPHCSWLIFICSVHFCWIKSVNFFLPFHLTLSCWVCFFSLLCCLWR